MPARMYKCDVCGKELGESQKEIKKHAKENPGHDKYSSKEK